MTERPGRKTVLFLFLVLAASSLLAEGTQNWSAPATWSPTKSRGVSTQDLTNPLPFIALAPCRILDTRGNGAPIQGGIFAASDLRNYAVAGICGIPVTAHVLSLNITVTGPGQTGAGFLLAFPTGGGAPPVSSLNWDHAPATVGNAAVVPTNTSTSFSINVSGPTHVIIDVNGYYYDGNQGGGLLAPNEQFQIIGNYIGSIIYGENRSTGNGARGVRGYATGSSGETYGVLGQSLSTSVSGGANPAGVFGQDATLYNPTSGSGLSGVRGTARDAFGVLGESRYVSVYGQLRSTSDALTQFGLLGTTFGTAADATTGPWGVFSGGNFGATGTKHFVEPHPTDPKKVIVYSSLEGREVGTYFRGTARVINHQAVIEIPEDFRIVTDDDGLTVQLTPVGASSSMYVDSQDLNQIVVRATRDVTFHYFVQGVRRAFKDLQPVQIGYVFMPRSATDTMPLYLTEEAKRRLIANGTYNQDGTVNMETAERAGFTRIWQQRLEELKAATDAARTAAAKAYLP